MFNSHSLCAIISGGDEEIIKWCQMVGFLRQHRTCDICGGDARLYRRTGSGTGNSRWRCVKGGLKTHSWEESVTKDTIFEGTKFGIGRILRLFYFFAHGFTKYSDLIRETSTVDETTSESTVSQWLTYCRKVCTNWMERRFEEEKIGGPGMTVQIGEMTIGKRKSSMSDSVGVGTNNKRRATEDQWVIGMVEIRTSGAATSSGRGGHLSDDEDNDETEFVRSKAGRFRVEVCPDNARDESTLVGFVRKHVRPGSSIVTDCWHSTYGSLESHGPYVVIDIEGSTRRQCSMQTIDNLWKTLKKEVCRGGNRGINDNLADHLCELMWRREMDRLEKDRFLGFVQCAVEVYNLY